MSEHPSIPPMDAAWWEEYGDVYRTCATTIHRLINEEDNPLKLEEVFTFGLFFGMTSRIMGKARQDE